MLGTRATEDAGGGSFAARIPPTALVLVGVGSVQIGSAIARTLFDDVGPAGTVMMRIVFASVVLGILWRPSLRGHDSNDLLLATPSGSGLNAPGVILALVAGGWWAAYILLATRTGRAFPGGHGLALAMGVAAILILPVGIAQGGSDLLRPAIFGAGLGVAVLSSLVPYSLEMEALRRLPPHVFGVLMSLEPAAAALAGLIVLGQVLQANEWAGMALVIVASAGATRFADDRTPAPRDA